MNPLQFVHDLLLISIVAALASEVGKAVVTVSLKCLGLWGF